jgi:hypothetical protein
MSDTYATAFAKGLKLANVKKVNLADNQMNEKGALSLL